MDGSTRCQSAAKTMNKQSLVYPDERVDEFSGLKVIQKINGPHFSLDAILLAQFSTVRKGDVAVDLGTGGGIISLILASTTEAKKIVGVEIQKELADVARRNAILNNLEGKIEVLEQDLCKLPETYPAGQFDLLVCNPPYRRVGSGRINPDQPKAIARHEIKCTLDDVLQTSFHLLKNRGRAAFVYRPDRLVDLIYGCRQHRLEPKRLQFTHPDADREANLVLLEAVKNSNQELKVLKPQIIRSDLYVS